MSNIENAKLLAKVGAILLIILGIAYILWNGVLDIIYYMSQGWIIDPWNFIEIGIGAIVLKGVRIGSGARIEAGAVDLAADLPPEPIDAIAAAATLVSREDLHPAVTALLVEAVTPGCSGRGVVENEGDFPSLALLDVPPSLAARRAVEHGPSFLFRVLPFQVAAAVDRLKILLLPLVTLLFPLFRLAPPLYRWRIRF